MSQSTVLRILSIEREATRIHDEATAQATQMLADFDRESSAMRERVLGEARSEATDIEREGQEAAQASRTETLAQADADAREMEERASDNFGAAVQYILDQVTGRL
jgi:vacuolar-type H+-ATPase subunit H